MRRAVSPHPARPPGPVISAGLDAHLADAIRLNRARRAGYVARGGVRAALLSRALVGAERALRPVARWLDRRAAAFWAVGVPILAAELSDLAAAPPAEQAVGGAGIERGGGSEVLLLDRRGAGRRGGCRAKHHIQSDRPVTLQTRTGGVVPARPPRPPDNHPCPLLSRRGTPSTPPRSGSVAHRPLDLRPARRALRAGRLRACAEAIGSALDTGRGGALTRHVLESAGLMALRGVAYARDTGGATAPLTRDLVRGHLVLVPFARLLDRAAAPLGARGVGLFVNDLPPVPFVDELRRPALA